MTAPLPDSLYSIFQHIYDSFGPISRDVIRNINLVRSLDKRARDVNEKINEKVKTHSSDDGQPPLVDIIDDLYKQQQNLGDEKIDIINICIDMLSSYSEKVDQAISSIVAKPSVSSTRSSTPVQSTLSKKRKFQAQSKHLESPQRQQQLNEYISPDELIYCYCRKVSYGNMIACDNPSCPYEWFHFGCVGMTEIPDGSWFCPRCTRKKRKNA